MEVWQIVLLAFGVILSGVMIYAISKQEFVIACSPPAAICGIIGGVLLLVLGVKSYLRFEFVQDLLTAFGLLGGTVVLVFGVICLFAKTQKG